MHKKEEKQRHVREACGSRCKLKCSEHLSDEQQQSLHKSFWNLGTELRRRDYVISHVRRTPTVRKTLGRKKHSMSYSLPTECGIANVCKRFFLITLDISDFMVYYSLRHAERMVRLKRMANERRAKFQKQIVTLLLSTSTRSQELTAIIVDQVARSIIWRHN